MTAADRRLPMLRRMALLCALLMLATIALSAFMRLSQAGLGCADWPACYGQGQHGSPEAVAAARLAHRAVASLALIGVMTMALAAWTARPLLRREKWLTLALLALALALAALGIVTPGARLPAVTMGNLLGGFAMLALCARLAAPGRADSAAAAAGSAASPAAATSATSATSAASAAAAAAAAAASAAPGLGAWGIAGLALLSIQLALGALVSASHAALVCTDLADCARAAQAQGWDWEEQ